MKQSFDREIRDMFQQEPITAMTLRLARQNGEDASSSRRRERQR